jgi:V-type H+-transporting ATPase subunit F
MSESEYSSAASATRHANSPLIPQDTVTGLLLSGIGHTDAQQRQNFLVVDASNSPFLNTPSETPLEDIEAAFTSLLNRRDIAIVLINQHVADDIRQLVDGHTAAFPSVLEIPSKDHP